MAPKVSLLGLSKYYCKKEPMFYCSRILFLFTFLYCPFVYSQNTLQDCGTGGVDGSAKIRCSDNHNIVKWTMGRESFRRHHRPINRATPNPRIPDRFGYCEDTDLRHASYGGEAPNFAYNTYLQSSEDYNTLERDYNDGHGTLIWGPYIDIPHAAEIEYEAEVWANIDFYQANCRWPDDKIMFQLELFTKGVVLSAVVMNWRKYQVYNANVAKGLYSIHLSGDGQNDEDRAFKNYFKVRGVYRSPGPIHSLELRINRFSPHHQLFYVKETSIKATYKAMD